MKNNRLRRSLASLCLIFTALSVVNAAPGLDPTFGTQGIIVGDATGLTSPTALSVVLGKRIIVAGFATSLTGDSDFALNGYKLNGKPDGFGGTGKVVTAITANFDDGLLALAVQPDGKILAVGFTQIGPAASAFCAVRYTSNGGLDTTFGTGGKALVQVGNGQSGASAVALQPDGKIVMAGFVEIAPNNTDFAVVRLTPLGKPDTTFGSAGIARTDVGKYRDFGNAIIVQPDQKIVVAGTSSEITNSKHAYSVVRFTSTGTLDKTFGGGGKVLTGFNDIVTRVRSIGRQTNGRIVVGGLREFYSPTTTYTMMGFNSAGKLDPSFGIKGVVNTPMTNIAHPEPPMVIRADDKIVVAGFANGPQTGFAIRGYDKNGTDIGSYGTNGPIGTYGDIATAIALQPDGKILVAGTIHSSTGTRFAMVRYVVNW